MTALATMEAVRALGCELVADGHTLHVRPGSLLTAELRAQIKAHKAEMLALLGMHCPTCNLGLTVTEHDGWLTCQCDKVTLRVRASDGAIERLVVWFSYGHATKCESCGRGGINKGGKCLYCLDALREAQEQATRRFITAGYAGLSFGPFKKEVGRLNAVVIDIRFNPVSQQRVWTKSNLEQEFRANYRHVGALGNKNYFDHSLPIEIADLQLGIEVVLRQAQPVLMLCVCASKLRCHRRLISNELERLGYWVEELSL